MIRCIIILFMYVCIPLQKKSVPEGVDVHVQDFIAITSRVYKERPLIGQVTSIGHVTSTGQNIIIDWYIGTYSGTWKPWRGRENGKTVTYTDTIDKKDIIQIITFTKGLRLSTTTVKELKMKYATK